MSRDERRLVLLERAAVAEEAGAVLRHDLRNKLASIRNAAFYLRRKVEKTELFETDARVPLFFGLIDDELVSAEKLMSDRVGLGHLFGLETAPTRLEDVVDDAVALAMPPAEIRIERALGETHPIALSPSELTLLVRSLVDNAVEAMPAGGTLGLRTSQLDATAVLEVEDSGTGIGPAERARAFEPFVSAKPGHVGIGLNLAKRIAERYSGQIAIVPAAGGTIVRATFPAPSLTRPTTEGVP